MHGYQYNKTTDEFIINVPDWDGTQPQVPDPDDPTKTIDDPETGITGDKPVDGCYLHTYRVVDEATGQRKWAEGDPDAAQKRAEQALEHCLSQRRARYKVIDDMRAEILMDALAAGTEPDYSPLVPLYQQIKTDIPKP